MRIVQYDRGIRYKEKIPYIHECLREIKDAMPEPSGIVLKGVFYNLSSAIEAMMDMTAMRCKDLGIMPRGMQQLLKTWTELDIP